MLAMPQKYTNVELILQAEKKTPVCYISMKLHVLDPADGQRLPNDNYIFGVVDKSVAPSMLFHMANQLNDNIDKNHLYIYYYIGI